MAHDLISESRLQHIYEGARCSPYEARFIIERLRISERAFRLLAEEPEVAHSARQFATHLLRGQGLVRWDHLAGEPAKGVRAGIQGLVTTARTRMRALRMRSAA